MADLDFCISEVLKHSFEGIDKKAKNELAGKIKRQHEKFIKLGFTPEQSQMELFRFAINEAKNAATLAEAQKLQLANAVHDTLNFISDANEVDDALPFRAKIAGISSRTKKWARAFGKSTNLAQKTLVEDRMGRYQTEMQKAGVLKFFNDRNWRKKFGGDLLEEIRNPGGTQNEAAAKIAEITKDYYRETLKGLHEAGLPFEDVEGFMGSYHRDPSRMLMVEDSRLKQLQYRATPGRIFNHKEDYELAFQRWKKTELKYLNLEKSFGDASNDDKKIDRVMRIEFDHQVLDKPNSGVNEKNEYVFRGLGQFAARRKRLFYKDGWAFHEANKFYGYGDVGHIIRHTLETGAKMEVFAKQWSTQPYTVYSKIKSILKERLHTKPSHLRRKLEKKLDFVDRVFDEVSGLAKMPVNAQSARNTNTVLCASSLATYGKSIVHAFTDLAGWQVQLHQSGQGWLKSFFTPFVRTLGRLGSIPKESVRKIIQGKEFLPKDIQDLGFWAKDVTGDVMSRFASADSLSGLQAKVMGTFFNLNLIHPWDRNITNGPFRDFARELWHHSKKSFDQLHPDFQFTLQRYNINEKEWDLIRSHSFQLPDNRKLITPDDPLNYTKKEIADFLGKKQITEKQFKDAQIDIRQRMIAMFTDRAHFIYLDNDPTEQAWMRMGTKPGTTGGNLSRLLVQSHAWPVGVARRILSNLLSNAMDGEGLAGKARGFIKDIPGLSLYVAGLYTTQYIGKTLVNLAQGKVAPEFFSKENVIDDFSEATGVYGQVLTALFGQSHYGSDPLLSATGPSIRTADDIIKIVNKAIHGQRFGSPLYHLIMRNIPGMNLLYVKPAFDYLIGYYIQEMMFPGSLRRALINHQKRVRDEGEAEYFAPPTSALGV
jgi:hypothetical protein